MSAITIPDGQFELVYRNKKILSETPDTVPTLVPKAAMNELQKGDPEPYYKIEAIDMPANGTGGIYEPEFFKSFINVLKSRPIAGSKRGHEWTSRPSSDFYTVGGKIEGNTAYFKIYIPPQGDPSDNSAFIRDARANIVNFSLVTAPEYNIQKDKDGNDVRHFTASKGYERNDAVEYGAGAMTQIVNSKPRNKSLDINLAKSLINNGQYRTIGNSDGDIIQNGVVMRPVLRAMLSHADVENKSELSELVSMIDKKSNSGGIKLEINEAYELIRNSLVNGAVPYTDVAKNCGMDKFMRTENDKQNESVVKELNSIFAGSTDLVASVKAMKAENESNSKAAVENAVVQAFGTAKIKNGKNEDIDNLSYTRAMELCNGKSGAELKTAIENAAKDPIIMHFRSEQADNNSQINAISSGKTTNASNDVETW